MTVIRLLPTTSSQGALVSGIRKAEAKATTELVALATETRNMAVRLCTPPRRVPRVTKPPLEYFNRLKDSIGPVELNVNVIDRPVVSFIVNYDMGDVDRPVHLFFEYGTGRRGARNRPPGRLPQGYAYGDIAGMQAQPYVYPAVHSMRGQVRYRLQKIFDEVW